MVEWWNDGKRKGKRPGARIRNGEARSQRFILILIVIDGRLANFGSRHVGAGLSRDCFGIKHGFQ